MCIILLVSMTLFGFKNDPKISEIAIETITNDYENMYFISKEVLSKVKLKKYEVKEVKRSQSIKELMMLLKNPKVELVLIKDRKNNITGAFTAMEDVYISTNYEVVQVTGNKGKRRQIKKLCQKICNIIPPPDCNGTIVGLPSVYGGCRCMCIPDPSDWDNTIGDLLGSGL